MSICLSKKFLKILNKFIDYGVLIEVKSKSNHIWVSIDWMPKKSLMNVNFS